MPSNLVHDVPGGVELLHINIGNVNRKIEDMKNDHMFQDADIITLNAYISLHFDIFTYFLVWECLE